MTVIARPIPLTRRLAAAAASALTVAAIAYGVTVLAFFPAAGATTAVLGQLLGLFLPVAIVTVFVMVIFAIVGIYKYWYLRVIGGLVGGIVSAVVGTAIGAISGGTAITSDVTPQLFLVIVGLDLIFVVVTTLATMRFGCWVWNRIIGPDAGNRRIAFVRAPADTLADGQVTHIAKSDIDLDLANAQWDGYLKALTENGWEIIEVPIASDHADSVFIEDAVVLFGDTAVITSPGAESRRGETVEVEKTVLDAGLTVERISLPGTLDGGDVLKVGMTVYVGRGGRTNAEGIRQLRQILGSHEYTVVAVPITKVLHLKSAVTALPDGTVIGYLPLVDDVSVFDRFLAMPEEGGAHVVVLAPDTVLMATSAPKSVALIESLGYRVITTDIGEFEKLEGCVTCLSVRVR